MKEMKYYTFDAKGKEGYNDENNVLLFKAIYLIAYEKEQEDNLTYYLPIMDLRINEKGESYFNEGEKSNFGIYLGKIYQEIFGCFFKPLILKKELLTPSNNEDIEMFKNAFEKRCDNLEKLTQ